MMRQIGKVDKKYLKKIEKNSFNLIRILEKYGDYLNTSDRPNEEKDAMFTGMSMLPIHLIMDRMDDNGKKNIIMWMLFQNKEMLLMDMANPLKDRLKGRKFEKDYIG